jgi:phospholipase/lecithinase/hemolysin
VDIAENFVRKIYSLGARKLSITGLIPMGCLPLERATNILGDHDCNEKYNNVAKQFNVKLENMVSKINKELPQLKALSANPYHIFNDIITRPSFYGMFSLFAPTYSICCVLFLHLIIMDHFYK